MSVCYVATCMKTRAGLAKQESSCSAKCGERKRLASILTVSCLAPNKGVSSISQGKSHCISCLRHIQTTSLADFRLLWHRLRLKVRRGLIWTIHLQVSSTPQLFAERYSSRTEFFQVLCCGATESQITLRSQLSAHSFDLEMTIGSPGLR